jgi:hypothetical protein
MYYDPLGPASEATPKKAVQNGRQRGKQRRLKAASTVVDVVADGGLSWIKVSLVTNTRLLFDLAKQGWVRLPPLLPYIQTSERKLL